MKLDRITNAIILIDKKPGITSSQTLGRIKKIAPVKKLGHSGTLDRFASGLLIVCTGWLTKLTRYFLDGDKRYIAKVRLGVSTNTFDREGTVIDERAVPSLDDELMLMLKNTFSGLIRQQPPAYSALKINGRRASDLAREGKEVMLKSRDVMIKNFDISRVKGDETQLLLDVTCSKGTYIRSIARDIGELIGSGAHLEYLRRVESGHFTIKDSITLDDLEAYCNGDYSDDAFIVDPGDAFRDYGRAVIRKGAEVRVMNGGRICEDDLESIKEKEEMPCLLYNSNGDLVAVVQITINPWDVRYLNVFNDAAKGIGA